MNMPAPAARSTYRHGDLRRALVGAGVELARAGGPAAVTLREATRRVGVSPNAAYRHFADRDDLLHAVWAVGQQRLADRIEDELTHRPDDPLRAVGTAYVGFAVDEPGLFQAAFFVASDLSRSRDAELAGRGGRTPYELLGAALDARVSAGQASSRSTADREPRPWPGRRSTACRCSWSAVRCATWARTSGPG